MASGDAEKKQFISMLNKFVNGSGKSPASTKQTLSNTQTGYKSGLVNSKPGSPAELPASPEINELVGRLLILTEEGVINPDDLSELSDKEFAELVSWIMDGAGGLFPPLEAGDILEKLKEWLSLLQSAISIADLDLQGAEAELNAQGGAIQPAGNNEIPLAEEVSNLLREILNASQAPSLGEGHYNQPATEVNPEIDTSSLLSTIAGLDGLTAEEKQALAEAFLQEVARIANHHPNPNNASGSDQSASAKLSGFENFESEDSGLTLEEILQNMDPAVLKQALSNAAKSVGAPPLLQDQGEVSKLPTPILKALAVEIIQVEKGTDPSLLAELDLLARNNILQRMITSQGNQGELAADTGKNLAGGEAANLLKEGEVPVEASLGSAPAIQAAANNKAAAETSNSPVEEHLFETATENLDRRIEPLENEQELADSKGESFRENRSQESQVFSESEVVESGNNPASTPLPFENTIVTMYPEAEGVSAAMPQAEPGVITNISVALGATETGVPSYVDSERNLEQVSQALRMSVRRGIQSATLRLSPPELGELKLQVTVKQGIVSAKLCVDTPQARDLLSSGLSQLREYMQSEGIRTSELSVEYDADENNETQRGEEFAQEFAGRRGSSRQPVEEEMLEEQNKPEVRGIFMEGGRVNTVA
ncbi:MAG: flagellar hook-length control protein FliK [Planctomycetes bacterium]|nr:flagellar hook-length control protein FliK [Planctomycetota bacterium]